MRALPVFFTGLAEEDLDQIEDRIAVHDPAAAARVRATIVQQSIQLGKMPEKGMALKAPHDSRSATSAFLKSLMKFSLLRLVLLPKTDSSELPYVL